MSEPAPWKIAAQDQARAGLHDLLSPENMRTLRDDIIILDQHGRTADATYGRHLIQLLENLAVMLMAHDNNL